MHKKLILTLLLLICMVQGSWAQGKFTRQAVKLGKFPAKMSVSQALESRVERTYLAARKACQETVIVPGVGNRIAPRLKADSREFYPENAFLSNSQQVTNYFIASNNRHTKSWHNTQQQYINIIQQNLDELQKGRKSILEGEEVNWIVSQIPQETTCLFLGEFHGFLDVRFTVADLLKTLKAKNPNRPVVLLTEFLPEREVFGKTTMGLNSPEFLPVWAEADAANIPVIGLEPDFVLNNAESHLREKVSWLNFDKGNIWGTDEGVRIRNTRWASFITTLRQTMSQTHPELSNALFIVYAGAGHTEYNAPFSLANMLPEEKIYSVTFFPTTVNSKLQTWDFDEATNGLFLQEKALQFKNRDLAKLAGFDIRLRIKPVRKLTGIQVTVSPEK